MSERAVSSALALYLTVAVVTFGHAAARTEKTIDTNYAECIRGPNAKSCYRDNAAPVGDGFFGAMLWPLYWSWEAWR